MNMKQSAVKLSKQSQQEIEITRKNFGHSKFTKDQYRISDATLDAFINFEHTGALLDMVLHEYITARNTYQRAMNLLLRATEKTK